MCRPVMGTRKNSYFPSRFILFLLLFKDLVYILRFFYQSIFDWFFYLPEFWRYKINTLFSIISTEATVTHLSFFIDLNPNKQNCSLSNEYWVTDTLYENLTSELRWTAILLILLISIFFCNRYVSIVDLFFYFKFNFFLKVLNFVMLLVSHYFCWKYFCNVIYFYQYIFLFLKFDF